MKIRSDPRKGSAMQTEIVFKSSNKVGMRNSVESRREIERNSYSRVTKVNVSVNVREGFKESGFCGVPFSIRRLKWVERW